MPYLYLASSLDLSRRHYRVRPSPTAEAWLESKVHFAFESQFVVKLIAALSPSPTGVSLVCTVLNTIRPVILFRPAHQSIRFDSIRFVLVVWCAPHSARVLCSLWSTSRAAISPASCSGSTRFCCRSPPSARRWSSSCAASAICTHAKSFTSAPALCSNSKILSASLCVSFVCHFVLTCDNP